jgi:hypothetical protein
MDDKLFWRMRGWHSNGDFNVDDLHEWLDGKGCEVLGTGAFGIAVDCDFFVVKVMNAGDDGYLNWIRFCELVGPCRYLPEIYFSQRISKHLHVVVMEKLEKRSVTNDREYKGIHAHGRFWGDRDAYKHLNDELKALLDLMDEYKDAHNAIADAHNSEQCWHNPKVKWMNTLTRDIHGGNVMFRGKQLVITDPWCV